MGRFSGDITAALVKASRTPIRVNDIQADIGALKASRVILDGVQEATPDTMAPKTFGDGDSVHQQFVGFLPPVEKGETEQSRGAESP